jgi:hypothetical protein
MLGLEGTPLRPAAVLLALLTDTAPLLPASAHPPNFCVKLTRVPCEPAASLAVHALPHLALAASNKMSNVGLPASYNDRGMGLLELVWGNVNNNKDDTPLDKQPAVGL